MWVIGSAGVDKRYDTARFAAECRTRPKPGPEWKYVNVRLHFIYIDHSIEEGTQWAVFEPNRRLRG